MDCDYVQKRSFFIRLYSAYNIENTKGKKLKSQIVSVNKDVSRHKSKNATAEASGETELLVATVGALRYRGMAFLYAVPAGQR